MLSSIRTSPRLLRALTDAKRRVDAMTPVEREEMHTRHRESWVRAEMGWDEDATVTVR